MLAIVPIVHDDELNYKPCCILKLIGEFYLIKHNVPVACNLCSYKLVHYLLFSLHSKTSPTAQSTAIMAFSLSTTATLFLFCMTTMVTAHNEESESE